MTSTKCSICEKVNLTKNPAGYVSIREKLKQPYQGIYIDFGFSGKVKLDKKGEEDEDSRKEVEGINGETSWILISDGFTRMLHGDC